MAAAPIRVRPAYEIARRVYREEISPTEGARSLHTLHGMNQNSARDLIFAYRHLMRGEVFHRGLSAPDMDYYLTRIRRDSGDAALRTALQSLWSHIAYYEGVRGGITLRKLRDVASRHGMRAMAPQPVEVMEDKFAKAVRRSLSGSSSARARRLRSAPKIPQRVPATLMAFDRNPDVVAEVLLRANGVCARCKNGAPFARKKDGTPYLEVHHKLMLALGGEDTVENAEALCPNCHRELHFGV